MGTVRISHYFSRRNWKEQTKWKTEAYMLNIVQIRRLKLILGKWDVENGLVLSGSE